MIYDVALKGPISEYIQNKLLHLVLETKNESTISLSWTVGIYKNSQQRIKINK